MKNKTNFSQRLTQLIAILAIFSLFPVQAQEKPYQLTLWQGVHTYHVDRSKDGASNEENKISAIFYQDWFVGFFNNSYEKQSEIVGYRVWYKNWQTTNWQLDTGVYVALATGYDDNLATHIEGILTFGFSPYVGAYYQFAENYSFGVDSMYVPTDNGGVFVTGLGLKILY